VEGRIKESWWLGAEDGGEAGALGGAQTLVWGVWGWRYVGRLGACSPPSGVGGVRGDGRNPRPTKQNDLMKRQDVVERGGGGPGSTNKHSGGGPVKNRMKSKKKGGKGKTMSLES